MKLVVTKPLQAVVTLLCVVTLSLHIAMTEMKVAMALVNERQEEFNVTNDKVFNKVLMMNDTVIRVETVLSDVKRNQENLLKRELENNEN